MAGVAGRSGRPPLSLEEHLRRGTAAPARHLRPEPPAPAPISPAERLAVLRGLKPAERRHADALLREFAGWNPASLRTLRSYVQSATRAAALEAQVAAGADPRPLYRELRTMMALIKTLNLPQD
jgi:hypothetical protein